MLDAQQIQVLTSVAHATPPAGAAGGAAGVIAGSPLDVVRVRLQQARRTPRGAALRSGFAAIVRREGVAGLFRGASYPLATGVLQNAVTFQAYGWALRMLQGLQVRHHGGSCRCQLCARVRSTTCVPGSRSGLSKLVRRKHSALSKRALKPLE